jgi:hypothetical protein
MAGLGALVLVFAPTLDDMRKQPGGSGQEPATDKEPRRAREEASDG